MKALSGLQGQFPKYVFCNGLRYVEPYHFQYDVTPRNRWIGKNVYDIFCEEFYAYDKTNYYSNAISKGLIKVNNRPIDKSYVFQQHDHIAHLTHRHEPPVCCNDKDIKAVQSHSDDKYSLIAFNKPASVPVHPVGRYRYNTLKWIFNNNNEDMRIFNVHRLDTLCSGLTIFTTNKTPPKYVKKIHKRFEHSDINKLYIAKVLGDFQPDRITVNAPIGILPDRKKIDDNNANETMNDAAYIEYGIDMVNGKESVTEFVKRYFDGTYSIIECYPKTGRSHQIRVHLSSIGYPIVNDVKYGGILMTGDEYQIESYLDDNKQTLRNMIMDHWDENCVECEMILKQIDGEIKNPFDTTKQICLHSLLYECSKDFWKYETKMPSWCKSGVSFDFD